MPASARSIALVACVGILAALAGPAAANGQVTITEAARTGNTATVSGTVVFPEVTGPQNVGGTGTAFANPQVAQAAGIDVTSATITPIDGGLRFTIETAAMPQAVPPEVVRYLWSFHINGRSYQLQAKKTNLASTTTTEDPVSHVQQAAAQKDFFQLRGACVTSYQGTPVAGCYHLAWLNGSFDAAGGKVTMDMPFNTRDQIGRLVAEDFKPGAALVEFQNAGTSIAGCFQAVVGTAGTCDYINGWNTYYIGGQVHLGVGTANTAPQDASYTVPATVTDGSFTGTIGGMSNLLSTVFVRACNGTTCVYGSVRP